MNFPLDHAHAFRMNKRQERHALLMIKAHPQLDKLRYSLCPKKMEENTFWYIYFALLHNRIGDALDDQDEIKAERDWEEVKHHTKQEQYKRNMAANQQFSGFLA